MKVAVKWLKSPRHRYGIPRPPGGHSVIDKKLADEILEVDPRFLEITEKEQPVKVQDTMAKKTYTRPVTRGKKDS
jgi:hypothetical protein